MQAIGLALGVALAASAAAAHPFDDLWIGPSPCVRDAPIVRIGAPLNANPSHKHLCHFDGTQTTVAWRSLAHVAYEVLLCRAHWPFSREELAGLPSPPEDSGCVIVAVPAQGPAGGATSVEFHLRPDVHTRTIPYVIREVGGAWRSPCEPATIVLIGVLRPNGGPDLIVDD